VRVRSRFKIFLAVAFLVVSLQAPAGAIHHEDLSTLAFTDDGNTLVTAGGGRRVVVWDLVTGHARENYSVDRAASGEIWLSPNGEAYAWRDQSDNAMYIRNWQRNLERSWPSWNERAPFDQPELVGIFSKDGRYLAVQVSNRFGGEHYRRDFHLYDLVGGESSKVSSPLTDQRELGFSSHGKPYRVQGGKARYSLMGVTGQGELVLSDAGKVIVRDMAGKNERALGGLPPGTLNPYIFHRTGYTDDFGFAVTYPDERAMLWSITENRVARELGNLHPAGTLSIDPTGRFVALYDPTAGPVVHLLETATGRDTPVRVLASVGRPKFSPDGSLVAFAMAGGAVTVLESATGLDALRTRSERFTRVAESLGVTTRYGLRAGKIGERFVPKIENTLYNTEVLFRLGDQEAVRVTGNTYSAGGVTEEVQGYHAIFGVANQSAKSYLVDILIEATGIQAFPAEGR
jgi:WD40 repeat protein